MMVQMMRRYVHWMAVEDGAHGWLRTPGKDGGSQLVELWKSSGNAGLRNPARARLSMVWENGACLLSTPLDTLRLNW
ncbi:hypothetical protein RRG08_055707 [Elysia crispata]|uniref:Uncharacterized protein n=1 Tax=Elysia crispata TaxID=231223 RepID=A0AAE1E8K6_9GAST|nr:hypothetical protein RRG08_055707 [Elysia crispata]